MPAYRAALCGDAAAYAVSAMQRGPHLRLWPGGPLSRRFRAPAQAAVLMRFCELDK